MKMIDRIGHTLLHRLVPGIDAGASCGQCRYSHKECRCCGPGDNRYDQRVYMDLCGRVCARQCSDQLIDVCANDCWV